MNVLSGFVSIFNCSNTWSFFFLIPAMIKLPFRPPRPYQSDALIPLWFCGPVINPLSLLLTLIEPLLS